MARVLLVDDEPMLRLLLRLVLENDGHDVRDCDDGRDALIQISSWRPDVVVTETTLPGFDATDLIKRMRMRSESVDMRILATSVAAPADADVDAVFIKPYEAQLVAKEIDAMLGEPLDGDRLLRPRSEDEALRARTTLLGDIWSRLVSVDSQAGSCDEECDVALEEIRRLAGWVDDRASRNVRPAGAGAMPDPDAYQSDLLGL